MYSWERDDILDIRCIRLDAEMERRAEIEKAEEEEGEYDGD